MTNKGKANKRGNSRERKIKKIRRQSSNAVAATIITINPTSTPKMPISTPASVSFSFG